MPSVGIFRAGDYTLALRFSELPLVTQFQSLVADEPLKGSSSGLVFAPEMLRVQSA